MKIVKEHKFISFLIVLALLCAAFIFGMYVSGGQEKMNESAESIKRTVEERALQCYVIEDAYPESLSYLEKNYGLAVNKKDFKVIYTPYAENMPPQVSVIYIGEKN